MVQKISLSELDVELRKEQDEIKTESVPKNSEKIIMSEDKEKIVSSEDAKVTPEEPKVKSEDASLKELTEVKETLATSIKSIDEKLAKIESFMGSMDTRNAALNELVSDLKAKLEEAPVKEDPKVEPEVIDAPVEAPAAEPVVAPAAPAEEPKSKEDELSLQLAQLSEEIRTLKEVPIVRNSKTGGIPVAESLSENDLFKGLMADMKK